MAFLPVPRQNGDGREQVDTVLAYQGNDTGTLSRWYYRVDVAGDFPYFVQGSGGMWCLRRRGVL